MKHTNKLLAGAALGAALALAAPEASAQGILSGNSRRMGATLNIGGSIGAGIGAFRLTPEFHYAFGGRGMTGPAIGVGVDLLIPGFGVGAFGRFAWNIQPLDGVSFFITPYGGLSVGGLFGELASLFYLGIHFGGEVRFIFADRFFLTVRPIGFTVPITVGEVGGMAGGGAGFGYDGAFGLGATF
ncbi:MAG: hypothetical protein U0269_21675 [Polyangiales bacterium]